MMLNVPTISNLSVDRLIRMTGRTIRGITVVVVPNSMCGRPTNGQMPILLILAKRRDTTGVRGMSVGMVPRGRTGCVIRMGVI